MDCRKVDKYLYDYCDNILDPEQKAQIEQHLIECPICSKIVNESLLESSILHEQWEIPELPDDFTARVMDRIAGSAAQAEPGTVYPRSPKRARWSRRLIGLAAMAAVLLLALYVPAMVKNSDFMQIASRKQTPSPANHETVTDNAGPQKAAQEFMFSDKKSEKDTDELLYTASESVNERLKLPAETKSFGEATDDASLKNAPEQSIVSPVGKINSDYETHAAAVYNSEESQPQDPDLVKANPPAAPEVISVRPVNLPAYYVLLNRTDAAGASTYTFGGVKNEAPLIINIARLPLRPSAASTYSRGYIREDDIPPPAPPAPAASDKSESGAEKENAPPVEPQAAKGSDDQTGEQAKVQGNVAALPAANTLSYKLEFNNQKFLLTLSAQLPLEELILIATNLRLSLAP